MTDHNSDLETQYSYYGCAKQLPKTDDRLEQFRTERETRGFDQTELWSLDMTIARYILPRIKYFAENYSHPENEADMKIIVAAFTLVASEECSYSEEDYTTIQKGLRLFAEYLPGLWT